MKEHQLLDHNADSIETSRFFSPKTTGGGVGLQTSVGLVFHKGFDLQVFEAFVYSSPQMNAYLNFMTVHRAIQNWKLWDPIILLSQLWNFSMGAIQTTPPTAEALAQRMQEELFGVAVF